MPRPKKVSFITHNDYDPETRCWNWTAGRDRAGYGHLRYMGRREQVHRVSAHIYLGFDLASNLCVCHRCDNPSCFNPKHLFIGTYSDNVRDALRKGRFISGLAGLIAERRQRTHCTRGHLYSEENVWLDKKGRRHCRICMRNLSREAMRRRRRQLQ